MWLALTLAAVIGLLLGLLGGGGSILTLPVLVYAAQIPANEAVGMSLAIVGATSAAGAIVKARQHLVHPRAAAWFSAAGMLGALFGSQLTPLLPPKLLLALFAGLMVVIALTMLLRKEEALQPLPECRPWRCALAGLGVGVLTGFVGVGGGFLLVPAMILFARLPLNVAVGTSLAVIAVNSLAGVIGHWKHARIDWSMTAGFVVVSLLGMALGLPLARRVAARNLNRAFALLVLGVAGMVLWRSGLGK